MKRKQPKHSRLLCRVIWIILFVLQAGCREEILHDISENDANRVLAELDALNIEAQKSRGADSKWSITVEAAASARAIRELNDRRALPSVRIAPSSKSFLPSREDELLRHERQLSTGIEDTLRNIPGVLEARVHLNLPKPRDLFEPRAKPEVGSGAVLLVVGEPFSASNEEIIRLVGNSSGIAGTGIAVVITKTAQKVTQEIEQATKAGQEVGTASQLQRTFAAVVACCLALFVAATGWHLLRRGKKQRLYLSPSRL